MATNRAPRVSLLSALSSRSGMKLDRMAPRLQPYARDPRVLKAAGHTAAALQAEAVGQFAVAANNWTAAAANLHAMGPAKAAALGDLSLVMQQAAAQDTARAGELAPDDADSFPIGAVALGAGLLVAAGCIFAATR